MASLLEQAWAGLADWAQAITRRAMGGPSSTDLSQREEVVGEPRCISSKVRPRDEDRWGFVGEPDGTMTTKWRT